MNVAFIMLDIPDLTGGGGAERFFVDFYNDYRSQKNPRHNLFLITDNLNNLKKIGKNIDRSGLLLVKNYRFEDYKFFNMLNKKPGFFLGNLFLFIKIYKEILFHKIQVLHIPLYHNRDFWFYWFITYFSFPRPRLILNIVDCRIPHWYFEKTGTVDQDYPKVYGRLFRRVRIDAVFTWYENVKQFFQKNKLILSAPEITAAASRYTSLTLVENMDEKENIIVYASRLDSQKNPFFYLDALRILNEKFPSVLSGWKFRLVGKGPLEKPVNDYIRTHNLNNILKVESEPLLSKILKKSKCFVSTQDFENFPSLSMAEAMAMGNVIIARNVGQTSLFVKDGINGFLLKEDTPESLADGIFNFTQSADQMKMGLASIELMKEVHNFSKFVTQVDELWENVKGKQ